MKLDLPFSDATIEELAGKTIVLSENIRNESRFCPFVTQTVKPGGDLDPGYFVVENGILKLMDKNGLFCEFHGTETRNGVVFAVGDAAQTVSKTGFDRITMHERKIMNPDTFGICISSNVRYEGDTIHKILDSIRKANFDLKRVVVVVGGYKGYEESEFEGVRVVKRQNDLMGFNGLIEAVGDTPYWLLMHDTCEAERSFLDVIGIVDIGLNPDVVRLRSDGSDWMGFYSKSFLDRIRPDICNCDIAVRKAIETRASVVVSLPGKTIVTGKKDVYGNGHSRTVLKIESAGIKKFMGASGKRIP